MRGSRVKNPAFFRTGRSSALNSHQRSRNAMLDGAGLSAHAAARDENHQVKLVESFGSLKGCFTIMRWVSSKKYCSKGLLLTVNFPVPGLRNTRAVDVFRRPVP